MLILISNFFRRCHISFWFLICILVWCAPVLAVLAVLYILLPLLVLYLFYLYWYCYFSLFSVLILIFLILLYILPKHCYLFFIFWLEWLYPCFDNFGLEWLPLFWQTKVWNSSKKVEKVAEWIGYYFLTKMCKVGLRNLKTMCAKVPRKCKR